MNTRRTWVEKVAFVLTLGCVTALPDAARACTSPQPPPHECATTICLAGDNSWDYRPKAFGTTCGQDGLGFCDGTSEYCTNPERGTVTPLYMITDVRYMPPGLNSAVSYGSSQSIGTATSVSKSFSNTNGLSVSVSYNVGLSFASATVGFSDTWTSGSTDSVSVVRTTSSSDTMVCNSMYCSDYLDHRNDEIVILAKPAVRYAAFASNIALPAGKTQVTWGLDVSTAVEKKLLVGWLNGTIPWPAGKEADLQNNYGIYPVEYPKILSATGYGYQPSLVTVPNFGVVDAWGGSWKPDPSRFQLYKVKDYSPGLSNVSGESISNSQTNSSEINYSNSYTVSASVSVGGGIMSMLTGSATAFSSWTWTNSTSRTSSQTTTTNQSLTLNMPQFGYSGAQNMAVYIDKVHQTFMFSYCSAPIPYLMIGCADGPPVPDSANGLRGSASPAQTPVTVSWTPVMGATSYSVWRSTSPSAGFASVASAPFNGFSFADAGANDRSVPYYYKVQASNRTGTGAESAMAVVPAAPSGLTASPSGASVYLSWLPAVAASSYTVWQSTASSAWQSTATNGTYTALATVAGTQFTPPAPPPGTKYFYVVTASSDTGSSARSNEAQVLSAPPTPAGLRAVPSSQYVSLSWSAATGATTYDVVRSTDAINWVWITGAGVSTTYAADGALTNGVTYYYMVRAVNAAGASSWSAMVSARPAAPPPPPPPACKCPAGYSCKCGDGRCYRSNQLCP